MKLFQVIKHKKAQQVISLYISLLLSIVIGLLNSIVNTKYLGEKTFGDLKFIQNVFLFFITAVNFGFFNSIGRILTSQNDENERKEIYGASILLTLCLSLLYILIIIIYSFFINIKDNRNLDEIIRIILPLGIAFPFQLFIENLFQGNNKINELAIFRILPQILYLLFFIILCNVLGNASLILSLSIQLLSLAACIIYFIVKLKPRFVDTKKYFKTFIDENNSYGIHVYWGALFSVATQYLAGILLGYYLDTKYVGFYSLAITLTMPLTMISTVIGTTYFKEFAGYSFLPRRVNVSTVIISITTALFFIAFIKPVFQFLYPSGFFQVVSLSYILSIGAVFHGIGDYINRFIGAHGGGKELRNGSVAYGIANILGLILLTKYYGVIGAVISKSISSTVYCTMMIIYYKQRIRKYSGKLAPADISN